MLKTHFKTRTIRYLFLVMTVCVFGKSVNADTRKVCLFPISSINVKPEICTEFTRSLKEKLIISEIFDVKDVKNFMFDASESRNVIFSLNRAVESECIKRNIKTAIYGYISKKDTWYDVYVVLYSAEGQSILSTFKDRIYHESNYEAAAKNCTVEFATNVSSIKGTKVFFGSALCPGLGHFMMKKYVRGAVYSGVFAFLFYKYATFEKKTAIDEDKYQIVPVFGISDFTPGEPIAMYYIDGIQVSSQEFHVRYDAWNEEIEPIRRHNEKIDKDKKRLSLYVTGVYLLSLLDSIFSAKSLDMREKIEAKFSFDVKPYDRIPSINFQYRF